MYFHTSVYYNFAEPGNFFPTGVKTTHKAYSSDKVFELVKQSTDLCSTTLGISTGFELKEVYSTWQPEPFGLNSIRTRQGVEGYYLLKEIPHLVEKLPVASLEPGSAELIKDCVLEVRKKFQIHSIDPNEARVRKEWDEWFERSAPITDSVEDYMAKIQRVVNGFLNPLGGRNSTNGHVIWDQNSRVQSRMWKFNIKPEEKINPLFKYPAVLTAAMNSVTTRFNPRPQLPRLIADPDNDVLKFCLDYEIKTQHVYLRMSSRDFTKAKLLEYIQRQIDYDGQRTSAKSLNKGDIVSRIKVYDKTFICLIFRNLLDTQSDFVDMKCSLPITTEEEQLEMVITSKANKDDAGVVLTRSHFRSLGYARCPEKVMDAVLDLFQLRDERICAAYSDNYDGEQGFQPRKRSLFIKSDFMNWLMDSESPGTLSINDFVPDIATRRLEEYYCLYFLLKESQGQMALVILEMSTKTIQYSNPCSPKVAPDGYLDKMLSKFKGISEKIGINFEAEGWKIEVYPHQYYDAVQFHEEIGTEIEVLVILYFTVIGAPIYFTPTEITIARRNICLWLLNRHLPK